MADCPAVPAEQVYDNFAENTIIISSPVRSTYIFHLPAVLYLPAAPLIFKGKSQPNRASVLSNTTVSDLTLAVFGLESIESADLTDNGRKREKYKLV